QRGPGQAGAGQHLPVPGEAPLLPPLRGQPAGVELLLLGRDGPPRRRTGIRLGDGVLPAQVDAAGAERGGGGHGGPGPAGRAAGGGRGAGIRAGMLGASGTIRPPPGTSVNSPSPRAHRSSPVTAGDQAVPGGAAGPAPAPPAAAAPAAAAAPPASAGAPPGSG